MKEALDEAGQDRGDHTEGKHVEGDCEKDEGGGGAAAFGGIGGGGGVFSSAEANDFRLGEQRVGCGATLGRIFGRVRHVVVWPQKRAICASLCEFCDGFLGISAII